MSSEDPSTTGLGAARAQWLARWQAMAPRERQLVLLMLWALGVTLVVMVGLRPAWKTLQATPAQLREVGLQLDTMRGLADEARVLRQRPPVPPAQAEAALQGATAALGSGATVLMQGDRATATFNKVAGPRLAEWLQDVRSAARARPLEASLIQVTPGVYSGTVTVALTAQPPAPR